MSRFVEISSQYLAGIANENDLDRGLYLSPNLIMRRGFWQRLHMINRMMTRQVRRWGHCLDFGGGSGLMLPTLSQRFQRVTFVDLDAEAARRIVADHELGNVEIIEGDMARLDFPERPFDAVVAADVLEHFRDLAAPTAAIGNWIAADGRLFTSLPTENWVYVALRTVFGKEKPWDHYHTAYEVEAHLGAGGFERLASNAAPLYVRLAPLYLISAWRPSAP